MFISYIYIKDINIEKLHVFVRFLGVRNKYLQMFEGNLLTRKFFI